MSVHICGIVALRGSCFSDAVIGFRKFARKACIYGRAVFFAERGVFICVAVGRTVFVRMRYACFRLVRRRTKAENVVKRLEVVVGRDLFKL